MFVTAFYSRKEDPVSFVWSCDMVPFVSQAFCFFQNCLNQCLIIQTITPAIPLVRMIFGSSTGIRAVYLMDKSLPIWTICKDR